ncbi:DUF4367 domain-containing protein [Candidatus Saccharibacteria bacterium]|nr:DUF4367 domain-containing protein [Candidatus Saccharibacteria bacterium]
MSQASSSQRNHSSSATHRVLQKSSTLNRRYVKRPGALAQATEAQAVEVKAVEAKAAEAQAAEVKAAEAQAEVTAKKTIKINVEDRAEADRRRQILIEQMATEARQLMDKHRMKIAVTEQAEKQAKEPAQQEQVQSQKQSQKQAKKQAAETIAPAAPNPYSAALARHRAAAEAEIARERAAVTAQEMKDQAIARALQSIADSAPSEQSKRQARLKAKQLKAAKAKSAKQLKTAKAAKPAKKANAETDSVLAKSFKQKKRRIGGAKFLLAFATSAACVAALGYFVHLNMPDISVRVAAMQTGIEATYPSYIPRDYQLNSVATDQDNRVIMEFIGPENAKFKLTEEKSSWDSNALLNNFVKASWNTNYTVIREQGITIYISNDADAAWVNGGLLYSLDSDGQLTKKQIKNIVTSL